MTCLRYLHLVPWDAPAPGTPIAELPRLYESVGKNAPSDRKAEARAVGEADFLFGADRHRNPDLGFHPFVGDSEASRVFWRQSGLGQATISRVSMAA